MNEKKDQNTKLLCLSNCCQVEGLPEKVSLLLSVFLLAGSRH